MAKKRLILGSGLFLLSLVCTHMLWAEFRVQSLTITNSSVRIAWSAPAGSNYVVQVKTNALKGSLTNGFFDLGPTVTVAGVTEVLTNYTDAGGASAATSRFYRVRSVVTPPVLQSLAVYPTNVVMGVGMTNLYHIVATYSDSSQQDVTGVAALSSLSPSVATVVSGVSTDGYRLVRGVAPGTANLPITFGGLTNTGRVTVATISTITVVPNPLNGNVGQSVHANLMATFNEVAGSYSIASCLVNFNPPLASVGYVRAQADIANCYALVTGQSSADTDSSYDGISGGGFSGSFHVHWCWYPYSATLIPTSVTIPVGQTVEFSLVTDVYDGSGPQTNAANIANIFQFQSYNTSIASPTATSPPKASGVGVGSTTVEADFNIGVNCYQDFVTSTVIVIPATNSWSQTTSGSWDNFASWSLGHPPDGNSVTLITNSTTKTVIFTYSPYGNPSGRDLFISGTAGTTNTLSVAGLNGLQTLGGLNIQAGGVLTISNTSGAVVDNTLNWIPVFPDGLAIGYWGVTNTMSITAGGNVINDYGYIGYTNTSANNQVFVTGTGAVWSNRFDLHVGEAGSGNALVISNGAKVYTHYGIAGNNPGSTQNSVVITGTNSTWDTAGFNFFIGWSGNSNSLVLRDAGKIVDLYGYLGYNSSSSNNVGTVSSGGSWVNTAGLIVGEYANGNYLVITNGGSVNTGLGFIGIDAASRSNRISVIGTGSEMRVSQSLYVGYRGATNTLKVLDGATVTASNVIVGVEATSAGNLIAVSGGNLFVTNAASNGALDLRNGTLTLSIGTVTVDKLVATNGTSGIAQFNGGTCNAKATTITNNQQLIVGDGITPTVFHLLGGLHSFANGLRVRTNATLSGCGTISGNLLIDGGGAALADCGGTMTFSGILTNFGNIIATNATTLESYGSLVNNGTINFHAGKTNFHGVFINNGILIP